jgi:hypothetical protein
MTATLEPDAALLPKYCPSWCTKDHAEDLADGATAEEARQHLTGGPGDYLREIRNYSITGTTSRVMRKDSGAWDLNITQEERVLGYFDEPTINLESSSAGHENRVTLQLTSGEARSLAAALVHLADKLLELR